MQHLLKSTRAALGCCYVYKPAGKTNGAGAVLAAQNMPAEMAHELPVGGAGGDGGGAEERGRVREGRKGLLRVVECFRRRSVLRVMDHAADKEMMLGALPMAYAYWKQVTRLGWGLGVGSRRFTNTN